MPGHVVRFSNLCGFGPSVHIAVWAGCAVRTNLNGAHGAPYEALAAITLWNNIENFRSCAPEIDFALVSTLCVGMPPLTLRVTIGHDTEFANKRAGCAVLLEMAEIDFFCCSHQA